MTLLSILLICLFCLAWLAVICASLMSEAASMIDNETNNEGNE